MHNSTTTHLGAQQGFEDAAIRIERTPVQDRILSPVKLRNLALQLLVDIDRVNNPNYYNNNNTASDTLRAANEAHRAQAEPVRVERVLCCNSRSANARAI